MQITKLSTRGQIVIPDEFRKDFEVGTPFIVTKQDSLIILKPVLGLTDEEKKEMKELDKIWERYDKGEFESYSADEFFAKMKEW